MLRPSALIHSPYLGFLSPNFTSTNDDGTRRKSSFYSLFRRHLTDSPPSAKCGQKSRGISGLCAFFPRIKRRKVKTTDYYAEFGDRLDSLLSSGAQMGYSHEDTKPGSPDTHRGPHPPDTGYTPGVSEPCRAHIRTPKKPRRFSGEGIFQPGVGVLGTAVAYRPASVKTLHAEESSSGYGCQH